MVTIARFDQDRSNHTQYDTATTPKMLPSPVMFEIFVPFLLWRLFGIGDERDVILVVHASLPTELNVG
jgi:hypothetical protein